MATKLLYVTCGNADEAGKIGRCLVEERLVACANIIPAIRSIYRWQGEICDDSELLLLAKTTASQLDAAIARIIELHSYDCPAVVAIDVAAGNPDFFAWVNTETTGESHD